MSNERARHGEGTDRWTDVVWKEATHLGTVLLIEGHDRLRTALSRALREDFYSVIEAGTGLEGIQAARSAEVDLVLLDLVLEDMSGLEVAGRLREIRPRTPVLALAAEPASARMVEESGIDQVLVMPVRLHDMVLVIDRLLEQSRLATGPAHGGRASGATTGQLTLELRDRLRSEHLSLSTEFPARVVYELLPQNEREIAAFQEELARFGIPAETRIRGTEIHIEFFLSVGEALSLGFNQVAPDELFFALEDGYPELARDPERLRTRIRELEHQFRRLQRIAS